MSVTWVGSPAFDIGEYSTFLSPRNTQPWREAVIDGNSYVYCCESRRLGTPLYVGYTTNIHRRLLQHRMAKTWWPLVDHIRVFTTPDDVTARDMEAKIIKQSGPLFNVIGNRYA
jgi:hypothetical protein